MKTVSPKEAVERLHRNGFLSDVHVMGTLELNDDKFQENSTLVLLNVIVEGQLRLSAERLVRCISFSHVVVRFGGISLNKMRIGELLFDNTVIHGPLHLHGTKVSEVLDLSGLSATALVVDYTVHVFSRSWERSADFLHCAAPAIPIVFDLRSNIERD